MSQNPLNTNLREEKIDGHLYSREFEDCFIILPDNLTRDCGREFSEELVVRELVKTDLTRG
jgi:hypothetical protein